MLELMLLLAAIAGLAVILSPGLFHLSAFTVALGTTANTDIAALTDTIIPIQNGHFIPYRDYSLMVAYASSATLSRSRLNSGTIRQVNPTYIRPITLATLPPTNPNVMWLRDNPFRVRAHEELSNEATSAIAMGTERYNGFIWLQSMYEPPPVGDIFILRATSTTAAVANVWTQLAYTLETGLPAGRYSVVDLNHQATNGLASRMIFDNQMERPGWLAGATLGLRTPYEMDLGGLGKWGDFFTYSLPRLEHLNNGTDASHENYIMVVKTQGGQVP